MLLERISGAWRRFRDAEEKHRDFEFTEILSLTEAMCHLYNKRCFHGTTRIMVKDFLSDMLPDLFENVYARGVIQSSRHNRKTYSEIRRFAYANTIALKGDLWSTTSPTWGTT